MKRPNLNLLLVGIVLFLLSGNLCAQSIVYLRSEDGEPWGSNSNIESLNAAFGPGNWQDRRFENVNINTLFQGVNYIFLEGSDNGANELESFLNANLPVLENWVRSGGILFMNAGPNEGNGMNFGFGGVSLIYDNNTNTVVATDPTHPIFNGPFLPVGTIWSGNSFGHATVTGAGLTPLIVEQENNNNIVLAEKRWGRGLVLFGGMTMTNFHSPNPEATNLRTNILSLQLLNAGNDAGVASLNSPIDFCAGTYPIEVVVKNFGINAIEHVTLNWQFDGVLQPPVVWNSVLDTINGSGPNEALVSLGSKNFIQGFSHVLKVWTSAPNGVTDTVTVNDTLTVALQPSLAGTFTIGGVSPDYESFSDAIASLEKNGVCGPVTFNVRSGTYNEQVVVPAFRGSSNVNTITFRSESGNREDVVLTYASEDYDRNFTLQLNGTSHVSFQHMTLEATGSWYSRVVEYRSGATLNEISNCLIQGPETSETYEEMALVFSHYGSSGADNNHFNTLRNNILRGGSTGVYYYGYDTDEASREKGMRIEGNTFQNQYYRAIFLYAQEFPRVVNNKILSNGIGYDYYGIIAEYCYDSLRITGNEITLTNGGIGIYQYNNHGTEGNEGLIANNFIYITGEESENEGTGIFTSYSEYQRYYHNSVLVNSRYGGYALNVRYDYYTRISNNIFANTVGGPVARYSGDVDDSNITADYNNLFTVTEEVVEWDNDNEYNWYTLGEWQQATGQESNSLSVNPLFTSPADLHARKALLDGGGVPLGVATDIDGEVRSTTAPDIGADEFTASGSDASLLYIDYPLPPFASGNFDIKVALQNRGAATLSSATVYLQIDSALQAPFHWIGSLEKGETEILNLGSFPFNSFTSYDLAAWSANPNGVLDIDPTDDTVSVENVVAGLPGGTYTIGGSSPDFVDISSAANVISHGGILGPVTFNLRSGTYEESVILLQVHGADSVNTVTFQSESGDSSSVVLRNHPDNAFTLMLEGADYITLRDLTFEVAGYDYGQVVYLSNGATNNKFTNNIIRGGNASSDLSLIYSDGSNDNNNVFLRNLMQGGAYGAYYYGDYDEPETGTVFRGNVFENQLRQALWFYYQASPEISNNVIHTNSDRNDFYGIRLNYCQLNSHILNNKIHIPNGGYGIYLDSNYGTEGSEGLIGNNFISIGGSFAYGIQNRYSEFQDIHHNNIHIYSGESNGYAYYSVGGFQHDIRNNIFANSGAGYAIYVASPFAIEQLDYNDLFSAGVLGSWSGNNYNDISAWKAATGRDEHSISANPAFFSSSDLHVNKGLLNNAGTPVTLLPEDIDGDTRNTTTPDIGADEFVPTGLDVSLIYLEPAFVRFGVGVNPIRIAVQNSGGTVLTSLEVSWMVNGETQTGYSWTGNLAPGQRDTLTIGNFDFAFGIAYSFEVTLDSPNGTDIDTSDNTATVSDLYAALGGSYTIGGSNPDFASFTEAVAALTVGGIYTNTVFNVRPGTYSEQISLPEVTGTGDLSRVTFQSENADSSSVTLTFASSVSGNNYTVQLNGADYITFSQMTIRATGSSYGRALDIRNGSTNNWFQNNRIEGISTTSTNTNFAIIYSESGGNINQNDHYNSFEENAITNGSYGFYYLGYSSGSGFSESGTIIRNNVITNVYYSSVYLQNQFELKLTRNTIQTNSNAWGQRAIYLQYCNNGSEISGNYINQINGGYGIYQYQSDGSDAFRNLIANNIIHIGGTSGDVYGVRLDFSDYVNIYHNTINITSTVTSSRVLSTYSGSALNILNNIFVNTGGGYGLGIDVPSAISALNYNNYYITGSNFGYWNGIVSDFTAWKSAHGFDVNSLHTNPRFVSATNLHVREIGLNGAATHLAEITHDFDGEVRDASTPDIGADEFTPQSTDAGILTLKSPVMPFNIGENNIAVQLRNSGLDVLTSVQINWELNGVRQDSVQWTGSLNSRDSLDVVLGIRTFDAGIGYTIKAWTSSPNDGVDGDLANDTIRVANLYAALDGTYTIGGTSPDFPTFNAAVNALKQGGVVDSAIFNVRAGTYNEQLSIPDIIGSYAPNTIIFQSENGDSTSVTLSFSAGSSNNYTLELAGSDGVTFRNMTLTTVNNSYGRVVLIRNKSNYNRFENNVIQGRNLNSTSDYMAVIASFEHEDNHNSFLNNRIVFGSYGLYYNGQGYTDVEEGTLIQGNIFENQSYRGIHTYYQHSPQINGNIIRTNSTRSDYGGIYTGYAKDERRIIGNNINISNSGTGIYSSESYAEEGLHGLIANNFINIRGGAYYSYGLYIADGNNQRIYHNTVQVATNYSDVHALHLNYVDQFDVKNNIFTNTGGGSAFYSQNAEFTSDYNDLYTTGENVAYYNGTAANFTQWKNITGGDLHSLSVDPRYVSPTDLHTREIVLNDAGTAISEVTEDIDREPRNPATPDIGADEFIPGQADAGIYALINPLIPFNQGTQPVTVALKNHGLDTLNIVQIQWMVNDTLQSVVQWTGALVSGDTTHVTLGNFVFDPATAYAIKAWTESPNNVVDTDYTNDTTAVNNLYTALLGTYTIGGMAPDFATFADAVTALDKGGVIGSVLFNVRAGSYNQQISIPEVAGTSAIHSVVFQTESGQDDVSLIFGATSDGANYTLQLDGASYITFRNLSIGAGNTTYGTAVRIQNESHHNTFESNTFNGINTTSTASELAVVHNVSNSNDTHNAFIGNRFIRGSFGYFGFGEESGSLESGTVLESNRFENQYYAAIWLYYQNSPKIRLNEIETTSGYTDFYGIRSVYNDNSVEIYRNRIQIGNGGHGVYIERNDGSFATRGLVANNFISLGGSTTARGLAVHYSTYQNIYHNSIHITSTLTNTNSTASYFNNGSNVDVKNNIFAHSRGGYAIYYNNVNSFTSNYNNLYTTGSNLAYVSGNRPNLEGWRSYMGQDLNSISVDPFFYSNTDLHVHNVSLNGVATKINAITEDFDGHPRTATPDIGADEFIPPTEDASILSLLAPVNPVTEGPNDVVVELFNNATVALNSVTIHWTVNGTSQPVFEWTGSLAPSTSDSVAIGSYLFEPGIGYAVTAWSSQPNGLTDPIPSNDTTSASGIYVGMAGTFTIGGPSADFVNFTQAVNALHQRSVAGPVTFRVADGIYSEKITINQILGASADHPIIFESGSGDSTKVTLTSATNSSQNYTLRLLGADHITFRKMTMSSTGSTYGRVIEIRDGSNYNMFQNCVFQSTIFNSTSSTSRRAIVFSDGSKDEYNVFRNNVFKDGAYGLYYYGVGSSVSDLENGTIIENNLFEDQYFAGIWMRYQMAPKIKNNTIITFSSYSSFYSIFGAYFDRDLEISNNRISSNSGGYGIGLENSDGTSGVRGRIYNNFIHLGGTSTAYGLYSNSSNYQDFSFNNVNITNTNTTSNAASLFNSSGSNIRVRNNILVNSGGGYAYYTNNASSIATSDYNDLYTTGANLAFWQNNYTSLEALQAASGKDANSLSVDPSYTGTADLHIDQPNLDGAGTPIADITTDIDGQLRHEVTPDIGADEFGAGLTTNDVGVVALVGPPHGCSLDNEESIIVRIQNFGIDTISDFSVTYVLNDTITVTENVMGVELKGGKSLEYSFTTPTDLSAAGFYNFIFYTTLEGDSNVNNDTLYNSAIRHYPAVNGTVSPNDTICQGSYVSLSASGGTSYAWRELGSSYVFRYSSGIYVNPDSDVTYLVEIANEFGCTDVDTVSVKVLPAPERPSIQVLGSTSVCTRDTVRLISSVKENITWNTGASTSEIQVFDPGTYTVTHRDTLTGCTSSRSVTLSYTPPPYIYAPRTSICQGESVGLTVMYGAQYLWSTGETTSSITVSPSADSTFTVDVINADGCEYLGLSVTIRVNPTRPAPVINSISTNTEICPGTSVTLTVQGNAQHYQWSNGRSGTSNTVSPTEDTQYTVTATNGECSQGSAQASVLVKVLSKPVAPIIVATGSSTLSFCDADSITLTSSDVADSLLWSTGASTRSITVVDPGVYSVRVVNQYGCSNSSSVTITDPPVPYIVGKSTVCEGESTTLSVNNGAFYSWSTGATTRSITVSPDTTTMYYVNIRNEEGCQYRDSIRVTILPKPVITGISGDTSICAGDEVTLAVYGTADRFIWSEGGSGITIKVRPDETTTYTVTATNGCTNLNFNDFSEVTVTVLPLPVKPVITPSGSTAICQDGTIELTSNVAGTIVWSTGDTARSITVSQPGSYTVTNKNATGCSQAETVTILNPPKPKLIVGAFTTICEGDSVELTYINATTFNWSTGETTSSIKVSPGDTTMYYIQASNELGCNYSDSIRINVIAPVPPDSVVNMVPSNDQSGFSLPLVLSWAPSANASNYDLYIWLDSTAPPANPFVSNIDQISYLVKDKLSYGATYNWQTIAKNSCHQTASSVQQFSLRELPDLIVNRVETPKSAFSGQLIDITWEVTNDGLGDTDLKKTWIDAVYLSVDQTLENGVDTYLGGAVNLTALNAGHGYRNTASFRLPKGITGERYVIIVTDQYNAIGEINNSNNSNRNLTSMLVNLTPPPDLQVDAVQAPNNVFSGQTINVSWTVRNKGAGATDASFWRDRVYISSDSILRTSSATRLGDFDHSGHLNPNETYVQNKAVTVPEGIFGPYFIYVVTDINKQLFEHVFENNNTGGSNGMQVILAPPPDLVVTSITVPASASNKETITISWEVQNQGGSPVSGKAWNDRIYISDSPSFSGTGAINLGERAVSAELPLGASYTSSRSVKIPDKINGPFFIYLATDVDNRVFEYENDDNNTTRSDTVDILSPDLIVEEITLPDTASSGKNIDVVWIVKNAGPGSLFNSKWEDIITVDNSAIYHADSVEDVGTLSYTGTLLAGQTMQKHKTVILPDGLEGTQFVHMQTDHTSQIFEAQKETNNLSYEALQVNLSPWPDLLPQIVLFDSDTATAGEAVPITYSVINSGAVEAPASWVDRIFISTEPEFDGERDTTVVARFDRLNALGVDSTYEVSTALDLDPSMTEGRYYFYLFTDAENKRYEHTDEANNVLRIGPVFIQDYPPVDFVVDTLITVDSSFSGTAITLQWEVQNTGEAESLAGYWFDAVVLSDDSLFDQTGDLLLRDWPEYGPLTKGERYADEQEVVLPDGISGDKYLLLVTDYGSEEKERFLVRDDDRSNNFFAVPIHITLTPPSDLTLTEFVAPTEGISGQPVSVRWTVTNQGVGSTTVGSWTDKMYLSTDFKIDNNDPVLKSYTRKGDLGSGASYTYSTDVFIPINAEGNYILILKTDNNDAQYEHRAENNNISTSIISVTKPLPADLAVTEVSAPDTVIAGENITVEWTIKNTGTNPATGVMSDIVYFSSDQAWDIDDVVLGEYSSTINLPPLSEHTRSLTAPVNGVSLADYYILIRTDVRNNIFESDDNNNETAANEQTNVVVRELKMREELSAALMNRVNQYYRIEIPDSLQSETLLVTLNGDSLDANNEIYIKYGQVPTRVNYDRKFSEPFFGDQEIVVPNLRTGSYYLLVYGESALSPSQEITLLASVLNFEIRNVETNIGGNSGSVTFTVEGSKFTDDMAMVLENADTSFHAVSMDFIDPTKVFVTFNLTGVPIGRYDVVAEKSDASYAIMYNGFEVQTGTGAVIETNLDYPASTRPGNIVAITIQFANAGNVDVPAPTRSIISLFGAPLSFNVGDLVYNFEDLSMEFNEPGGPAGVLRPGAISEMTVYTKAIRRLRFRLTK